MFDSSTMRDRSSHAMACWVAGLGTLLLGALGCSDGDAAGSGGAGGAGIVVGDVSFHEDVEPILHRSCLGCHTDGQIGGFSLEAYADAKALSGMIAAMTEARLMPPFHAQETEDCQPLLPWKDDPRLSDEEIAILRAWDEQGAPEGDPANAPPPFAHETIGLPGVELELSPDAPGTIAGDSDLFECVAYDPAIVETRFIQGIHILPGNDQIAHHALIFRTSRESAASLSGGAPRWPCFGGPPGDLIHAWAPGGVPLELPQDVGMELTPDDVIVVQMHYHPTGTSEEEDTSTIQLRFTETSPLYAYQVALPGNAQSAAAGLLAGPNDDGAPEFRIPANVDEHVEEMAIPVPAGIPSIPILLVATHMHYVGVDMRFWIERPRPDGAEPAEECFVHTPSWDFNWQRGYMFDAEISELPTASPGDILHLRCVYDNTMNNRFVVEALEDEGLSAPQDVYLGEQTLDEMCLAGVGILTPNL
jgi:hypothetical protein